MIKNMVLLIEILTEEVNRHHTGIESIRDDIKNLLRNIICQYHTYRTLNIDKFLI